MFTVIPLLESKSAILKPLSAITASPVSNLSIKPDSMKSCRSDIEPPYKGDMNEKVPHGVMPARALAVL